MSKNTDKLFVYDELFQTIICFNKVTRWLIFSPMALCISRMKSSLQKKNENWKQKNTNWHMLYFDTLQIGRPFLHKAGSHDSCCSNLNQKSMIWANIFNWQSIALGKTLNNCALWTIFLWIHNKKLPFTLLLLLDHSILNCFSLEILAHCVQPSSNYVSIWWEY